MWWREDGVTTAPPPSGRTQRLRSSVRLTPCYRVETPLRVWYPGASWAAAFLAAVCTLKNHMGRPSCTPPGRPRDPPGASVAGARSVSP